MLMSSKNFNLDLAVHGGLFFTDFPVPGYTNIQVAVPETLILMTRDGLLKTDMTWEQASAIGFDGRFVLDIGEPRTIISKDRNAHEIVVFNKSIQKLGSISEYH
jgi:hypothetical protein